MFVWPQLIIQYRGCDRLSLLKFSARPSKTLLSESVCFWGRMDTWTRKFDVEVGQLLVAWEIGGLLSGDVLSFI